MLDMLTRAGCFLSIILLGIVLRRIGFFKESDFRLLSKIALRITLPALIVVHFSRVEIEWSMLSITLIAIGCGALYMAIGYLVNINKPKEQKAFSVLNYAGYNIGLFTMPFVLSFMGAAGAIVTGLFDVGNAFICLGGAYGVAASVKSGCGLSFKRVFRALFTSVPFLFYMAMITVNLAGIKLPGFVISWAETIQNANAFLAMLMIGVGFKITASRDQIGQIVKVVLVRYSVATLLALVCYYLLPFSLEARQALVILVFSPIGSATPAFTEELGEDSGLSSAINSICILCSIVIMLILVSVMLY